MNLQAQHIPHPVASAAMARPEHPAVRVGAETITWSGLHTAAARAASLLADRGLRAGDRVALHGPISTGWAVAMHAIDWLGAVLVPLPLRATRSELRDGLADTTPRAVISDDRPTLYPGPDLHIPLDDLCPRRTVGYSPMAERFQPLEEVRAFLGTSGSVDTPRWTALNTRQILFSAFGSAIRLGHQPQDQWLSALPLHHVGGLSVLWRTARYGTTAVLHPRFDPDVFSRAMDEGVTLASMVPEMLRRVLDARADRPFLSGLRAILVGGAPSDGTLVARCRAMGAPVAITWGMTETASQLSTAHPGELSDHAGVPLPFTRVRGEGETLVVHGPVTETGVWCTHDRGRVDEEGRVHVAGRADAVIVSGGEKIAPEALEDVLRAHPTIADAGVCGIDDPRWGQRPVAWLVAAEGHRHLTDEALGAWVGEQMSAFKVPVAWRWTDVLPRTDLGKLRRRDLRSWREQADPAEGLSHLGGNGDGGEGLHVHEDVHVSDGGAEHTVVRPDHLKDEGQGTIPGPVDGDLDPETLPHPHGVAVVGLGVGEGHAPRATIEDGLKLDTGGAEELLVRHVAVLEDPTEERDPCAVDLLETNRNDVLEGHDGLQDQHTEGTWEDAR
jgi:O-succinylbenzoic acid--CoA ligase